MLKGKNNIIGYFGYTTSGDTICTQRHACLVTGSEKMMQAHLKGQLENNSEERNIIITKITFGKIMEEFKRKTAFAFDEDAYNVFLPLAQKNGINELPGNELFSQPSPTGRHYITIKLNNYDTKW